MREYSEREYKRKFQTQSCPRCLSRKVKEQERTKGGMSYKIYICGTCNGIIRRETIV